MLGIGPLEIAVIVLIAFLVLGPTKSIDVARTAGKVIRELRGSVSQIVDSVDLDKLDKEEKPPAHTVIAPPHESQEYSEPRDQK